MSGAMNMNRAHIYWALVPGSVLAARMAPVGPFTFKDLGGRGLTTFEDLGRSLPFSVHSAGVFGGQLNPELSVKNATCDNRLVVTRR